jgi:hypothetical protein
LKKHSARLEEPFVFFVDRCLGRQIVPDALKAALEPSERVEIHDDHFAQDARDVQWLKSVGERGWGVNYT